MSGRNEPGFTLVYNAGGRLVLQRDDGEIAAEYGTDLSAKSGLSLLFGQREASRILARSGLLEIPEINPEICPPVTTIIASVWISEEYSDKLRNTGFDEFDICEMLEKIATDKEPRLRCINQHHYSNFVLDMECPTKAFPEAIDNARGILSKDVPELISKLMDEASRSAHALK